MKRSKAILTSLAVMVLVAIFALSMPAAAQPASGGADNERGEQRRQWDPEAMRARMMQAFKDRLGASDDEWAVIEPRLNKVSELRREAATGGMRGMMGRGGFGNRGNRGGGDDSQRAERTPRTEGEPSAVQTKSRALGELLNNEAASPDQIKKALDELRAAKSASQKKLEAAQASLREVLSLRQEAMLVTMGLLE